MKKALVVAAVLGVFLVPVGAAGGSPRLPVSLVGMSPSQILDVSLRSAADEGSCTNVSRGTAVGFTFGSSTDSGARQARQSLYFNRSRGQVLLIGPALYMKESAALLSVQFGKAGSGYANRWLLVPPSSESYHPVSSGLLFSSMITQVRPAGALHESKVGVLGGVRVVALSGKANSELGLTGGVETLFVRAVSPYLPVRLIAGGRAQGVPTSLTVTFSQWGRHFSVGAPQHVLALSPTAVP